jgi:NAD(P)-dependent dehydrogenase (short-subunit alcohol dehydrogenase family)
MPSLDGKVAIVTGAGRGIGREHALHLARAGAKVVVNDLGASMAGEGEDVGPAEEVVNEIKALGGDAIVNGANVADYEAAGEMVRQAIDEFGEVRGRVVNTSSPSGVFGNVGQTNYGAAKAGIAALTVIAAQELGRYGVTVNCIAPNARTRMTEDLLGERAAAPEEGFDPMHPANNSKIVVALCADEAQGITGQVFHVSGGAVNCLTPWGPGEMFYSEDGWDPDDLLQEVLERFPDGRAPKGMMASMAEVGAGAAAPQRP